MWSKHMAVSRAIPRSDSTLPAYLAGTMLLRGRARVVLTAALMVLWVAAGVIVQIALDDHTNAVTAAVVFPIAWMWGRMPGAAFGFLGTLGNAYWADSIGLEHPEWSAVLVEALAIAAVAALIGHIGVQLERALGARARADVAFGELEHIARERMLRITDQVPVGLYRTTPEGRIIGGNDALMSILGFTDSDEMLKANVWDHYVRAEDREQRVGDAMFSDGSWSKFELRRTDGNPIWVRDWSRAITDATGKLIYFDGVIEDITEQQLADERFRAAFEDSPYGMTISSADGYLIRANAAIARLLGHDRDKMSDMHFSEFSFDDELDITTTALDEAASGNVVQYEKRLRKTDGSYIWALISLAPIRDGGVPQLFISHVIDITEVRAAREGLENLVRSKDELIASVSHELRTPLTVVHGLAQELDSGWMSFSVSEQKEFIGLIAQQSAEVAHIVEDLLVAARADIGKLPINAVSVDIRDELESALRTVPELGVSVEWVGDRTPVAFADATRVRQIIRNLLVNARRYGGPTVRARFGANGQRVWLEILDDGRGIPEDAVKDIFEPYSRAHNAEGQPASVGLGLTVSRKLAELMGGSLEYRYESNWAYFRLELPVAGSVPIGSSPTLETGSPGGS